MTKSTAPTAYLAAPSALAAAALAAAVAAVAALGFEVHTATPAGNDVDDLVTAAAVDLDALDRAALVVTLPGADRLWEPTYAAEVRRTPVVALADVLTAGRAL